MRKEVIFAILSGSALGLIIAFGVWRANQAIKSNIKQNSQEEQKVVSDTKINQFDLTIASPETNSITTSSKVTIQGITKPNTYIVASTESTDKIVKVDNTGSFSVEVPLSGGINPIKVTSLDPANGSAKKSLNVIYSSEFNKFLATVSSDTKESTSSADAVREKVKEKIAQAQEKPLAYLGLITDITDTTVQIKNDEGEIQQISLDPKATEYVKLGSETKKVELKDLAIGDYIAALGFKNSNNVLSGKRVLITSKPEEVKFVSMLGTITNIGKKDLTIKDNHDTEWSIQFGKKWSGPELKKLETDKKIIIIGSQTDNSINPARTLYLIEN
ncbi:hypothetical protein KW795_01480 [Candidatus Microgenomates bacterium]|nr:hypothetical protein [Candidatus Microgenomates bacterium]